jgi:hypothetical protein
MGQDSNLKELRIRWDMLRPTLARVDNINALTGEDQLGEAIDADLPLLGTDSAFAPHRVTRLLPDGLTLNAELQPLAQALSNRSSLAIVAEGEVNTEAFGTVLRAKRPVLVRGVGALHSGAYLVERVLHLFVQDEYTQSFTLRRNATGPQPQDDFTAQE